MTELRIGSLFSGAGGLDLAVQQVFGGEVVWHAEIDKAASKVLAHRFPGVPNLGDISAVDWADVPEVDVLCGGFPCQDVSAAGKRAGIKDGTRSGLWSVFADAIDHLRPRIVVIENVRGLLSATAHRTDDDAADHLEPGTAVMGNGTSGPVLRAAGAVLGDLADLGYDAQWATVAAADVGAPHRRERVFVLATDTSISPGVGLQQQDLSALQQRWGDRRPGQSGVCDCGDSACVADAADTPRNGWDEGRPESARLVGGSSDVAVSRDGDVALLPTPGTLDSVEKRTTHAGGNLTLQGAVVGVNPVDVERDSRAGRTVAADDGVALLPTPSACNANDGEGTETWLARREAVKARVKNGNGMGMPLSIAVQLLPTPCAQQSGNSPEEHLRKKPGRKVVTDLAILVENGLLESGGALLPTLNAQDGNGGGRYSSPGHQSTLPGEVRLLPTPRSSDCFGAGQHGDGGMDLRTTITMLPTPRATDSKGKRNPDGRLRDGRERTPGDDALPDAVDRDQWGKYEPAIRRWESIVGPAPAPTEPNKNGNPRLSAAFSEWLMGWPAGWVTDPAIGISRNDQLRIVGNGVVSLQCEYALRFLLTVCEVTA